jgi:hypothetical protein
VAYDRVLADRVRGEIGNHPALSECEMFGGIAFLVGGNMAVGVSGDELMVRMNPDAYDDALTRRGAHPFDMAGGRPMRGWLLVSPEGIASEADFSSWVALGVAHAESLPSK